MVERMKEPTAKASLVGAGGASVAIAIAIAHEPLLLALVAGAVLTLAAALICLVWAVIFAETDGPTTRFERVTAALAQLAEQKPTTQPRTDTATTRPLDSPQGRRVRRRPRR